jgi:hypothetical protein
MSILRITLSRAVCLGAVLLGVHVSVGAAFAQNPEETIRGNQAFDALMNPMPDPITPENSEMIRTSWEKYLRGYGPALREQYVSSGASTMMTFEQFAYLRLTTPNGTNAPVVRDQTCRQFDDFRWVEARRAYTQNWCDDSGPFINLGSPQDPDAPPPAAGR